MNGASLKLGVFRGARNEGPRRSWKLDGRGLIRHIRNPGGGRTFAPRILARALRGGGAQGWQGMKANGCCAVPGLKDGME